MSDRYNKRDQGYRPGALPPDTAVRPRSPRRGRSPDYATATGIHPESAYRPAFPGPIDPYNPTRDRPPYGDPTYPRERYAPGAEVPPYQSPGADPRYPLPTGVPSYRGRPDDPHYGSYVDPPYHPDIRSPVFHPPPPPPPPGQPSTSIGAARAGRGEPFPPPGDPYGRDDGSYYRLADEARRYRGSDVYSRMDPGHYSQGADPYAYKPDSYYREPGRDREPIREGTRRGGAATDPYPYEVDRYGNRIDPYAYEANRYPPGVDEYERGRRGQYTEFDPHPQVVGDSPYRRTERDLDNLVKTHVPTSMEEMIDCPARGCTRTGTNGFKRKDHMKEHMRSTHGIDYDVEGGGSKTQTKKRPVPDTVIQEKYRGERR